MSNASSLLSGGSTDSSQDASANVIDPSASDDLHHALTVLIDVAGKCQQQMEQSDDYSSTDAERQQQYVSFLSDVLTGPRDFNDPEGTGHVAEHNTRKYRNEYGNSAPELRTEPSEQAVKAFDGNTLTEISGDSVPEQDHIEIPYSETHDRAAYYAVPEGQLQQAQEIVRDITTRVIPEAESWFDYMDGNVAALEGEGEDIDITSDDSGTTSESDNDLEEPFQRLVSDVDGMGRKTVENFRHYVAANDWQAPDEIEVEVTPVDQYDSLDQVPAETLTELSTEQIQAIKA